MKLDQQKNGWKSICIHHQANGDYYMCLVRAAGWQFLHIHAHMHSNGKTFFSAVYDEMGRHDISDKDI